MIGCPWGSLAAREIISTTLFVGKEFENMANVLLPINWATVLMNNVCKIRTMYVYSPKTGDLTGDYVHFSELEYEIELNISIQKKPDTAHVV